MLGGSVAIGAALGYLVISPLGMAFFHLSHAHLSHAEVEQMGRSVLGAIHGSFGAGMVGWWGSFLLLGSTIGCAVGLILLAMDAKRRALARQAADLTVANEQLVQAYHRLAHADRLASVGLLSAAVIHDMSNYLMVIGSMVWQQEEKPPEERDPDWARVIRATDRIRQLCESARRFSRGRSDEASAVDVHVLVREALALLEKLLAQAKIEVVTCFDARRSLVEGHPAELLQVLVNLIKNAIDAMPSGGRLELASRNEGGRIIVTVSDDGPGIPAEVLPQVFDAFFTTKGEQKGTGLGLAICRRVVSEHAGRISAETRVEGGARLRVELPCCPEAPM
jgi:signal transduction histidine kinase